VIVQQIPNLCGVRKKIEMLTKLLTNFAHEISNPLISSTICNKHTT
jgi:hypothetical protein